MGFTAIVILNNVRGVSGVNELEMLLLSSERDDLRSRCAPVVRDPVRDTTSRQYARQNMRLLTFAICFQR